MMLIMYNVKHPQQPVTSGEGKSMKISKEQVAQNRAAILEAAARMFRERGLEKVTVAEVMQAAGLTHGAFYGHFKSKDDLVAQAFGHALKPRAGLQSKDLAGYVSAYLSAAHRDDRAGGCPYAALGTEAVRAPAEVRTAMTLRMREQIEQFAQTAPGGSATERRRAAIGGYSAMLGAMILARIADDPKLSNELLRETKGWLSG
jgi:TetR/AcrR family transcriptional repressor of nem operon